MADVLPVNYRIHLEPDLKQFRFEGSVEILIKAETPVRKLTLNAVDLAIWRCRVLNEKDPVLCAFSVDPKKEEVHISLPRAESGEITLQIDYVGEINDRMAGFYRSKYTHRGTEHWMAVTQFEESDARRAFPCFDHPARKATFDVELVIEEDLTAISNGPVREETLLGGGRKLVKFQRTPRMSTYLLFFGVGEFEFLEQPGEVLLRLAARPGMTAQGGFALDFSRKALLFSEEYYGIPYPLPKLDVIAVTDFAAGAMENWGAITFRENLLLRDPEKTSSAGEERICEVIAHEMAHQWFGNLVTPADWKYLWLNESFATYFGYGVVDHYHPEWEAWSRFLQAQTDVALDRDALKETFSIEIPGGEHVVINASTAPIIYNKGGSMLRQIEGYVGADGFREGLRAYLKSHAYGCASSNDLWEALEAASAKPVSRMIRNWVEEPGYPIIEARREGPRLLLTQERFTCLPMESSQQWLIPVAVRVFRGDGSSEIIQTLLEAGNGAVEVGEEALAVQVNVGQTGFYRVKYADRDNLRELGRRIAGKMLGPEERWGIQNDLFALVRRGDHSLGEYMDFLSYYGEEESFLPIMSVADHLYHAFLITGGEWKHRVQETGRIFFESVLARIGYEPVRGEKHTTSIMREQILWHAAVYGSKAALGFGEAMFSVLRGGKGIHPDLMRCAMQIGALQGGEEAFDWLDRTLTSSDSEHERVQILLAMGCFREKAVIEKALEYILARVPDRNKFIALGAMGSSPYALAFLWDWYVENLHQLERLHPVHYERVITALVPLSGLGRETEIRKFFAGYMRKKKTFQNVIRLSLERLEINSRMRRRNA